MQLIQSNGADQEEYHDMFHAFKAAAAPLTAWEVA